MKPIKITSRGTDWNDILAEYKFVRLENMTCFGFVHWRDQLLMDRGACNMLKFIQEGFSMEVSVSDPRGGAEFVGVKEM